MMRTLLATLLASVALIPDAQQTGPLKQIATIPLPGVEGRFDHCSIDVDGKRLFVAALGNNTLEVLDIGGRKRIESIKGLRKPTGVLYLKASKEIVVANGDDGTCRIFDGTSYKEQRRLSGLDDADNLRLDPEGKFFYLGFGDGALGIVDGKSHTRAGEIKLKGHPESFQLERGGSRAFVNVPDANHVAVIDRTKIAVISTWALGKFKANFPMALDEGHHRLFIGCRSPARLVVLDTGSGKSVGDYEISGDTDDLFYDAQSKRIYLSCGEGFLDVFEQTASDSCRRIQRLPTASGARTCFFSADLNHLYLAVPHRGKQPAEIRVFEVARD